MVLRRLRVAIVVHLTVLVAGYAVRLLFYDLADMESGKIGCMKQLGITESWVVKRQVLLSAAEAAEMILRVDDILRAAPRKRVQDRGRC